MKKTLLTLVLILIGLGTANAQVGIGTTSPDASAQLELQSTAKGFLPPRMDSDDRDDISSPAQGLMIYCTNCGTNGQAQVYNGTEWTNMTGGSASAGLHVPDAPTIDGVTSGDGQVDVAFTAPADDGGSTITQYTATSDPGDYTGTLSQAGDGTITVSGLTNGTEYKFTITATNAVGTSAASAASSSVTPAKVPDAPTIDGVTSGDGQVEIAFTAPADDGGSTITEYTATSNPGDFTGTLSQAGNGTITVSGLTNGTEYTFTVTATNAVGTSAASAASASVTPSPPPPPTVIGPSGKVWMDRNLGATQKANAKEDDNAYGDLYQWGRAADGHEKRSSPEHNGTSVIPTTITDSGAWNGKFITNKDDWVTTKNDGAWNTGTEDNPIKTATDPCPSGFRLPTNAEWVAESNGWNGASDAFNSKLKLPVSGFRNKDGELYSSNDSGFYWSSTASLGDSASYLQFRPGANVSMGSGYRSYGFAIRCIKE